MRNGMLAPLLDPKRTLQIDRKDIVPLQPAERVGSAVKERICKVIIAATLILPLTATMISPRLPPHRLGLSDTMYSNHDKRLQTA